MPLVDKLPQRGFRASEHRLRKAFIWFDKRLDEYIRQTNGADPGLVLAQFIDRLSDKFMMFNYLMILR